MQINTAHSTVYISDQIHIILDKIFNEYSNKNIFILVDENTKLHCLPIIKNHKLLQSAKTIDVVSGEINKSLKSLEIIWNKLIANGADRSSLLINLGGGIICDMGGFAASTFKRGMSFINIPTTLLSQVDASIGGKTGINYTGLKNEIGVFSHPQYVIIDSSFNRTIDKRNILSGWAEMLKHALIFDDSDLKNLISHNIKQTGFKDLNTLIARSISIKNHFVEKDPTEKNIRKALNLGHTFGHAFESLFMNTSNELLHGEAIAHGILCELYLSNKIIDFPKHKLDNIVKYILEIYQKPHIEKEQFELITNLMLHDKKNEGKNINFTLLKDIGQIEINKNCTKKEITECLEWYTNL